MIKPNWVVPSHIKACTLVQGDNLTDLSLPYPILRLKQVHDNEVITWQRETLQPTQNLIHETNINADGAYTTSSNTICTVATADCLPILITNQQGTEVAALHAGWRGLAKGILEQGVKKFTSSSSELIAWLGPAICPQHYEVGEEVYQTFISQRAALSQFFIPTRPGHWLADITGIARFKLTQLGLTNITCYAGCTFEDKKYLYSYRRDKENAGRLLHLIWIEDNH